MIDDSNFKSKALIIINAKYIKAKPTKIFTADVPLTRL
jgi:hypothetical protein